MRGCFPGGSTVHPQDETEFEQVNPEDKERRLQELPSSQCLRNTYSLIKEHFHGKLLIVDEL